MKRLLFWPSFILLIVGIISGCAVLVDKDQKKNSMADLYHCKLNGECQNTKSLQYDKSLINRPFSSKLSVIDLKEEYFSTSNRIYRNINAELLYHQAKKVGKMLGFEVINCNQEKGLLLLDNDKGISRQLAGWSWMEKYSVLIELQRSLIDLNVVFLDIAIDHFKKSPISNRFSLRSKNDEANKIMLKFIKKLDSFVAKNGGEF